MFLSSLLHRVRTEDIDEIKADHQAVATSEVGCTSRLPPQGPRLLVHRIRL